MEECQIFESEVGGRKLVIETGKLAEQANAAVTVRYGDTVVLVTVCVAREPREDEDIVPLTVDYEERLYAAGKIPGGFIRREGRPSQEATLASRLTDRTLRPLLPKTWRNAIQLVITVLSADQENDPDILAVIGGSAVLGMSEVPFAGPVSAVRVGYINGQMILNPTLVQLTDSLFELIVASTKEKIVMLEAGAKEVSESIISQAIKFGHEANQGIIRLQEQLQQAYGRPKMETPAAKTNSEVMAAVSPVVNGKLEQALFHSEKSKREQALSDLEKEVMASLGSSFSEKELHDAFDAKIREQIRSNVLANNRRISGRSPKEIRQITGEVGLLPRTHGSALFTRGQTQVLTITTLGSPGMQQQLDGLGIEESKRFMHHYNFPPFSTGEVKRMGTPGRREIGHGALAERALIPILPGEEAFPYTIRLVSEVLSSSGSTSMASVCASSLSMMDAGVPTKKAVAGIALGLVTDDTGKYVILTDIEGIEDNYGDMDFKVAGTTDGITAVQMDTKLKGLTLEITDNAIEQAREARASILEKMNQIMSSSRAEISKYAPMMCKIKIDQSKIGSVIGPGGKTIRSIVEQTKATVDIQDDGTVTIGSANEEAARKAIEIIKGLTADVEIGSIYTGKVTRILPFGALVEILPGKEGMIHISELTDHRVETVEDEVKVGDEVTVMVLRVEDGKIALSRKAIFEKTPRPADTGAREHRGPRPTARRSPPRRDYEHRGEAPFRSSYPPKKQD